MFTLSPNTPRLISCHLTSTMAAFTTTPLLRTLNIPSNFIPRSNLFTITTKPIKTPLVVSLSSPQNYHFTPQKSTFSSKVVTFVAQSTEWDNNVVVEEEQEEVSSWENDGNDESQSQSQSQSFEFGVEGDGGGEGFSEPPEEAKLFVGNLPFDVTSELLAQTFQPAGIVEIAEVIYNRDTDRSRGFGFITMSTVEEAEKAVDMFNGYELNGRFLTVNKAAPRGTRPERAPREFGPSYRIYVGNLPWDVDDGRLEQVFSEHGKVVVARVVSDRESGRSRGFGFVTMASETEMNDAIAALDGQTLDGRAIRVNVAEERPRRSF